MCQCVSMVIDSQHVISLISGGCDLLRLFRLLHEMSNIPYELEVVFLRAIQVVWLVVLHVVRHYDKSLQCCGWYVSKFCDVVMT